VAVKSDVRVGHDIAYVTRGHASGCAGAMAYYTRTGDPLGTWEGRGCAALGVSGTVQAEVAERLYQEGAGPGGERIIRHAAHCPGRLLQPQRCFASRCAGRACGAPLTLETSADPAGLTARAKPKARPDMRAANLYTGRTAGIQGVTDCPHGRK
jgi:hypothetical protein